MRNLSHQITSYSLALGVICILALNGCATTPPQDPEAEALIFPTPPAEARFVFERSLRFNENVEQPSTTDRAKRWLAGGDREVKGLVKPFDVAAHQGRIYVTDTVQHRVVLFDIPGGRFREFGETDPGKLAKPTGITVAANGDVYVVDTAAQHVVIFDAEGRFLRHIGVGANLQRPSDIAIDNKHGRLYVVETGGVDSQQHGVRVFDLHSGADMQRLGTRGSEPGQFNIPLQASVAPDGTLYVNDSGNFRVQAFTPQGQLKFHFGTLGRYPGQFARAKGVANDADGNIYVVDAAFGNFQIFDPNGQLLLFIGQRGEAGRAAHYMLPSGIAVDEDGRVYVVDQFFRKVDVFRPARLERLQGFTALPPAD